MLLTPEQKAAIEKAIADASQPEGGVVKRKALSHITARWKDGIVPYVISDPTCKCRHCKQVSLVWLMRVCYS